MVVDADDFGAVTGTYPEHPLTKQDPMARTMGELKDLRQAERLKKIETANAKAEEERNRFASVERPYIPSEFNIASPPITSVKQRKAQELVAARRRENLTDEVHEQKDDIKHPSLAFVPQPKIAAKSILEQHRRDQMLVDLKKIEKNVGHHKDAYARINERENCALRMISSMPPSKNTRQQLDQQRRAEMVADNTAKFGNVTIGIHGGEMPHFSATATSKEWWKMQQAGTEAPKIQSRLLLKQSQQFWAKNDLQLLSDVQHEVAPIDPFKVTHVPKNVTLDVPDKINTVSRGPDGLTATDADVKAGYKHKISWTAETETMICKGKDRTFDKILQISKTKEAVEMDRERKLQEYFSKPQRGTAKAKQFVESKDVHILQKAETLPVGKSQNAVPSHRSGAEVRKTGPQNQRSQSQLETLDAVSAFRLCDLNWLGWRPVGSAAGRGSDR